MALRVDSCVVLLVVMSGCMLVQMQSTFSPRNTTSFNNTSNSTSQLINGSTSPTTVPSRNGTNQNTNGANQNMNGANQNTNGASSASFDSSTNQNAKNATASTSLSSSSSSSMTCCFKLLLPVFMVLRFLQIIQ